MGRALRTEPARSNVAGVARGPGACVHAPCRRARRAARSRRPRGLPPGDHLPPARVPPGPWPDRVRSRQARVAADARLGRQLVERGQVFRALDYEFTVTVEGDAALGGYVSELFFSLLGGDGPDGAVPWKVRARDDDDGWELVVGGARHTTG